MAGDWIKWTCGLIDKPEVVRLAARLKLAREVAVCRLMKFWEWCDANIASSAIHESGSAFVDLSPERGDNVAFVDALVGTPGFADSLAAVDWIRFRDGRVELPNFGRHNGETAKTRARNSKNQKKKRQADGEEPPPKEGKRGGTVSPKMSPPRGDKTVTRGEERRDKEESTTLSGATPPPAGEQKPKPPRKEPTGPHADARRAFCERWKAKYGDEYSFDFKKHGEHLRWMLTEVEDDVPRLVGIMERFIADKDEFYTGNPHLFEKLRQNFNRWKVAPKTASASSLPMDPYERYMPQTGDDRR